MDIWNLAEVDVEPRNPVVLHSDEGAARAIAIRLPAGQSLTEHQVHEHAWLHVHEGTVEVAAAAGADPQPAPAGSLVHWAPGERHAVTASEDALLLLLLAPWPGPGHPNLRSVG